MLVFHIDRLVITYKVLNAIEKPPPNKKEFAMAISLELEVDGSGAALVRNSTNSQSPVMSPDQKCPLNTVL